MNSLRNCEAAQIADQLGIEPGELHHHVEHYIERGENELERNVRTWWAPTNPHRQLYRRLMRMLAEERRAA